MARRRGDGIAAAIAPQCHPPALGGRAWRNHTQAPFERAAHAMTSRSVWLAVTTGSIGPLPFSQPNRLRTRHAEGFDLTVVSRNVVSLYARSLNVMRELLALIERRLTHVPIGTARHILVSGV